MAWGDVEKAPLQKSQKRDAPDGLWVKCKSCKKAIFRTDFEQNQNVCMVCQHHYPIDPKKRMDKFLDRGSFEEFNSELESPDPLNFTDTKSYKARLEVSQKKTARKDAIITGRGTIKEMPVLVGVMDFGFMGGSMGSVVGEKIARLLLKAASEKIPAIMFSSSGGARMQEGILSLMQMG
ncbi:acetyl-CoA carboxylase carboxyl transferase subunit beta, partial [bacterium]|nr:acetyl-CoA carboxylase carboxyl transferase subunit beta [bacterium]